jgi:hypothetical protein
MKLVLLGIHALLHILKQSFDLKIHMNPSEFVIASHLKRDFIAVMM